MRIAHVIRQTKSYYKHKMASTWVVEKEKLFNLPIEEKRMLYEKSEYVTLAEVPIWSKYTKAVTIKPSEGSVDISLNQDLNKTLANKVSLFSGDITKLEIDAIVNAANTKLIAGGGVDHSIHRAAGPLLQEECHTLSGCAVGEAKLTGGYNLPAKYVIQTVGPRYSENTASADKEDLQSCYENSFALAKKHNIKTIAFPCISTGIYQFPNKLAAQTALSATRKFLENNLDFERVIFCTFMPVDTDLYKELMLKYFPIE